MTHHSIGDPIGLFFIFRNCVFELGSLYYYYYVQGAGWAVSVGPGAVDISLSSEESDVDISILTADIVGNAIRDGTGLIDVSDFPNSQDFNSLIIS